jgi:hypothetical protein
MALLLLLLLLREMRKLEQIRNEFHQVSRQDEK